jgi:hypothetical protein
VIKGKEIEGDRERQREIKDNTVPTPGPSPSGAGNQRSLTEGKTIGHRVDLTNAHHTHKCDSNPSLREGHRVGIDYL